MHEHLDQAAFVWAAVGIGVTGLIGMVAWSLIAMVCAERRRDAVRRK